MEKKKSNLRSKTSTKHKQTKSSKQSLVPIIDENLNVPIDITEVVINSVILEPPDTIAPKKLKPREKEHYVNGRDFEEEIRQYYKTGFVTIKLGESINKIANGLSYAPNFINYSYKEDMVGDAIVKMFSALKNQKFRLDSGFSPFSYFTTIAFHAFINRIKKEKRHHETLKEYKEKVYTELMLDPSENGGAHIYVDTTNDDEYE
jgi:hypothetical protein